MNMTKLARMALFSLLGGLLAGAIGLIAIYFMVSASLPRVDSLADYRPPVITRIMGDDGTVVAEFFRERRIVVSVDRMPEQLIRAFVAAEDSNFFDHQGIDFKSIIRAAIKNLRAGGIVQGGSTITQQVAKSLLLTPERKFSRKFKEAILAWRMEKKLSKTEILYLYLNQIYLGHGAYGVQAAAENYFGKNVEELSLAESAMLAGLPQAPSRYSPYHHYKRAVERQKYVLGRMLQEGFVSQEEIDLALAEELVIHPRPRLHIPGAAYFTEQVRRYLEARYGAEQVQGGGLEVHTTINPAMQQAAQLAVQENLRSYDRRRGYRGPMRVLSTEEEAGFLAEQTEQLGATRPPTGSFIEGVLVGGEKGDLLIRCGAFTGRIPSGETGWAGQIRVVERGRPVKIKSRPIHLPAGSVLLVGVEEHLADGTLRLSLQQEPEAQGALVALDPRTGQVKAMVGGYDFGKSQFNRAIQARRLPGSAFKPFIYSAAIDKGYTPATIVLDTPLIYRQKNDQGGETEWKPKNYRGSFTGATSLRNALTHSYNVVTVKILEDIGVGYAIGYARKLGIQSPLNRDLTLALGSSAVSPLELATAYCPFANGGVRPTPVYVTKVLDRTGRVLESVDPADFPNGPEKGQNLIVKSPERVISPETAYLVTNMMESVVRDGTGMAARSLGRPVAGKTGTTNDLKDAWFVGYVPQLLAASWIGYDQERSLGNRETGSRAALPAWLAFMQKAVEEIPAEDFTVPDNVEFRPIDPVTGLLAPEDSGEITIEVFAPGTAPTRYALELETPEARDFFMLDMEDF
ncbi:MAG: PBP1A family penicillin-binding protein [Syntrophotaleaceae bacterium]